MKKKIIILIVTIFFVFLFFIFTPKLSKSDEVISNSTPFEEIEIEILERKDRFLLFEDEIQKMEIDTGNLNIIIENKETGIVWKSLGNSGYQDEEKSLLDITFLGEDGEINVWDSFKNGIDGGNYSLFKINNGVRINLNLSDKDTVYINEYIPLRISIDRYESIFIDQIKELEASGEIEPVKASKYRLVLRTVYA